jgi:predicted lysophospholipase L1 biosynthesis ABC-type transport system permease subunit
MQVLLSRRKTEIAMLKTAGYHRRDLYLLFGLEAGMLGLVGGIIGAAAAIGVSFLVRNVVQNVGSNIPFVLNPGFILGGVVVGCVTALIFGLLPIAQAANIRPLSVLREFENKSVSGRVLTIVLLVMCSILFCLLAIVILNNDMVLGIAVTYGTFVRAFHNSESSQR